MTTTSLAESRKVTEAELRSAAVLSAFQQPVSPGEHVSGQIAMWRVLKHNSRPFALSCVCGVINQGAQVAAFVSAGFACSAALSEEKTSTVALLAVAAVSSVLIGGIAAWFECVVSHRFAFLVLAQVRGWLFRALVRVAPAGLMRRRSDDLLTRITSDAEGIEMFYAHTLIYVVSATVVTPLTLIFLAFVSPLLGGIAALGIGLLIAVPLALRRHNSRHGVSLRRNTAQLSLSVGDLVQGLDELTAFGAIDRQLGKVRDDGRTVCRSNLAQAGRMGLEEASAVTALGGCLIGAMAASAWLIDAGGLAPADVPAIIGLILGAAVPVTALLGATRIWGITTASAQRVFEVLAEPDPVPLADKDTRRPVVHERPQVELDGVSFRYSQTEPYVLSDVTSTIPFGQIVAVVGHSGAGKSTLGGLVLRIHDPQCGQVRIGGADIRDITEDQLRRLVTTVPQDHYLFHDTIRHNVTLGDFNLDQQDFDRSLNAAHAEDFVRALTDDANTVVGDQGERISGGERQRLSLARALARSAPILILDEPVSQLDAVSEQEICGALNRLRGSHTVLIIAHRLSTVRIADRVLVLDRGELVGDDSYERLLANCPEFRRLMTFQLKDSAAMSTSSPQRR